MTFLGFVGSWVLDLVEHICWVIVFVEYVLVAKYWVLVLAEYVPVPKYSLV